ncbi:NADH dehydrogenase [ubiquinone] iron-sulfur protein 6, mitochondrial-like [Tubulanus polymorphus]|uniref:NADH dehydrogenase [ubiquinone] iron-sulfur protein 6, mitochondrial-like n=1 Tax=Tubulanus polymorphus TaxID=672921 RepID=UPI003DA68062
MATLGNIVTKSRYFSRFGPMINRGSKLLYSTQSQSGEDFQIHTGQKFEQNDWRLARFNDGKSKVVNKNFAIDLIAEVPPKACTERVVHCDGGGGPLGHPKVFINLDQPGNHTCGYCGLRFYLDGSHGH